MRPNRTWQWRGQALIEGIIVALLFVPLFAGVWMLASLQDLQAQIIQTARFVAIQHASKPTELRSDSSSRIARTMLDESAERSHLWRDPWSGKSWLDSESPARIHVGSTMPPEVVGRSSDLALASLRSMQALSGRRIDLQRPHYVDVELAVPLRIERTWNLSHPLVLRERLVVLDNGWSAQNIGELERRVRAMSALNGLRTAEALLRPFRPLLQPLEPSIDSWCPGRLDVEIVPEDRLGPVETPHSSFGASRSRC